MDSNELKELSEALTRWYNTDMKRKGTLVASCTLKKGFGAFKATRYRNTVTLLDDNGSREILYNSIMVSEGREADAYIHLLDIQFLYDIITMTSNPDKYFHDRA